MSEQELKPCPFCGKQPRYSKRMEGHAPGHYWPEQIECVDCGICFRTSKEENVVRHWNTRTSPEADKLTAFIEDCIGDLEYDLSCGPMLLEKMKSALAAYRKGKDGEL